ncbi:MAG: 6-hydroxymethylpterin diphosphokinase MptE-like protein [Candidatus Metalachnospira sp.]|nr:6-hydroxymethylpterin diphosphokinase MptE-like protein [Candidatus Metalachnospira sp.]
MNRTALFMRKCKYKLLNFIFNAGVVYRKLGSYSPKYHNLKKYQNVYKGKRCFILCTGPSLNINDLEMLEHEYTFGMNSICLVFDKTKWRPTFFGIQDDLVYKKVAKTLHKENKTKVLYGSTVKLLYKKKKNWIGFPLNINYHLYERLWEKRFFAKFSHNAYFEVYDGYSITYSLIQIAIYMGFKEIYLLGADCSFLGTKQHFIEHGHYDNDIGSAAERNITSYAEAKNYADQHNIKIFNATRGGKLEIFPRVSLEQILR